MRNVEGLRIAVIGQGRRTSTLVEVLQQMGGQVVETHDALSDIKSLENIDCLAVSTGPALPTLLPPVQDGG